MVTQKEWAEPANEHEKHIAIDEIIDLLNAGHNEKYGTLIKIPEPNVKWLIKQAREIFEQENTLLELVAPIKICGDFHG